MEHCKGGDLFKVLMMKGGTLDEAWVCREVISHPGVAEVDCLLTQTVLFR